MIYDVRPKICIFEHFFWRRVNDDYIPTYSVCYKRKTKRILLYYYIIVFYCLVATLTPSPQQVVATVRALTNYNRVTYAFLAF